MANIQSAKLSTSAVMALFAGKEVSFSLAADATFADLAEGIGHLDGLDNGMPTAIYLKVGTKNQAYSALLTGV